MPTAREGPHRELDPLPGSTLRRLKELFAAVHQPMSPSLMAWESSLA